MALKAARARALQELAEGAASAPEPDVVLKRRREGAALRGWLLGKYVKNLWSARDVCESALRSTKAGSVGVEDLCLNPGSFSYANQHLDDIVNGDEVNGLLGIPTPTYQKRTCFRGTQNIPFRPAHSTLAEIYRDKPPAVELRLVQKHIYSFLRSWVKSWAAAPDCASLYCAKWPLQCNPALSFLAATPSTILFFFKPIAGGLTGIALGFASTQGAVDFQNTWHSKIIS